MTRTVARNRPSCQGGRSTGRCFPRGTRVDAKRPGAAGRPSARTRRGATPSPSGPAVCIRASPPRGGILSSPPQNGRLSEQCLWEPATSPAQSREGGNLRAATEALEPVRPDTAPPPPLPSQQRERRILEKVSPLPPAIVPPSPSSFPRLEVQPRALHSSSDRALLSPPLSLPTLSETDSRSPMVGLGEWTENKCMN